MYANSISTISTMFNPMFNIFLVQKQQLSQAIALFSFFVLKFLSFVSKYVLSIKATSPHEGNLRVEGIGKTGTQLFCIIC